MKPDGAEPHFLLTILRAPGKRLVKRFDADGHKHGYDKAAEFRIERRKVRSFRDWCALLSEIEQHPDRCVIRGAPGPWASPTRPAYRLLHPQLAYTDQRGRRVTREEVVRAKRQDEIGVSLHLTTFLPMFVEEPTAWVLLDFEGIEFEPDWRRRLRRGRRLAQAPAARCLRRCLLLVSGHRQCCRPQQARPRRRQCADAAGLPPVAPLTQDQLEAWLGGIPGLDPVTFRTIQPIYVGRPVFTGGLADPIPIRSGVLEGLEEVVPVPDDLPAPRPRDTSWHTSADLSEAVGLGLLDCPELDDALAQVSGKAGKTRHGLALAARTYIRAVGPGQVDVEALAQRLAEEGRKHRSAAEVESYGLPAYVRWHLAQAPELLPQAPEPGPHYEALEEAPAKAALRLRSCLEQVIRQAMAWTDAAGDPEQTGIVTPAGLGKTTTFLDVLSEQAQAEVRLYVPAIRLAEEAAWSARERELRNQVIRGREAVVGGLPLCRKHEEARIVARAGLPVMETLCRKKLQDGTEQRCEFFEHCRYLKQFRVTESGLRIFAHEYLFLPPPKGLSQPALIVIDEAFALRAARHASFCLDRLTTPRTGMKIEHEAEIHDVALKVRDALEKGLDPRAVADADAFGHVLKRESTVDGEQLVWPSMIWREQKRRLASLRKNERLKLCALWRVLRDQAGSKGALYRVELRRNEPMPDGEHQDRVHVWWSAALHLPRAPVLLLDATLDEQIVRQPLPRATVHRIAARRNAVVIQVKDTACSRNRLLSFEGAAEEEKARAANRLADVRHLAEVEAYGERRVLLVTYKAAAERLGSIPGVDITHFGALRGLDRYKDHDTIIIAGREQPPVSEVESLARSIFGDEPLALLGGARLCLEVRGYRMHDGSQVGGKVEVHPDPRCQAILEQIRERESEQAIDRLRLVHRETPARVLLLSNVVLDVTVDRLVTWNELIPDRFTVAAARFDGVLPLAPAWLAERCPDLWPQR